MPPTPDGVFPSVVQMSYRIDIDPSQVGMTRIAMHQALNPSFAQFHLPSHILATQKPHHSKAEKIKYPAHDVDFDSDSSMT